MKLKSLFEFCIEQGIQKDPRGTDKVYDLLKEKNEKFKDLNQEQKDDFDKELLTNPYADSRILNGTGDEDISSILVGIDIETPEILLAYTLKTLGKDVDLVLSHHPEGIAYATLYKVLEMHVDVLNRFGVPINAAEFLTNNRIKDIKRKLLPQNHSRASDAARLLGIPFMSAHTIADNHVATFLQNLFNNSDVRTIKDIIKILKDIPEYKYAIKNNSGPVVLNGADENRVGKIFVDMTGGTEGPKEALEKLAQAGIGTIVGMHMSEEHYKDAQKYNINVVIAGHIASDTLGMNLLLDAIEQRFGQIQIIECSGFKRFRRL